MMKLMEMLRTLVVTPLDKYILAFVVTAANSLYLSQVMDGFVPRLMVFIFALILLKLFARRFRIRRLDRTFDTLLKILTDRIKKGQ